MGRKPRIAHVITRLDLGGAQQNTLFCVRQHDRSRFEVELIAGQGGALDDEARAIPDARVAIVPYLEHAVSPRRDPPALLRLRDHFRAHRIDLVHTHSSKAGILGRWAARLAGVPAVVHTAHGWSFNSTQRASVRRMYTTLERITAPITDRLVTVSRTDRDRGVAAAIGRAQQYRVLHSGIEIGAFDRPERDPSIVRRELGIDPHHVLVGTVACLKPQKAPLDFVRAAAAAHARCERMRFVIVGDGELREAVSAEARRLGIQDVVRLTGWRRDVADLLHAMDLFLLTSRFEGLPRAVLQAMAAGVPVVATAVDGTPEVVRDGRTGLLVSPGQPDEAARRLLEIVGDPALGERCVEGARRVLDERFEIARMVRDLEAIYISLLEERG